MIRFKCPTCLRKTLKADAGRVAISIADLTCPACGVRWRFKIVPRVIGNAAVIHAVTNTARITTKERRP
jgi:hypothetical protein